MLYPRKEGIGADIVIGAGLAKKGGLQGPIPIPTGSSVKRFPFAITPWKQVFGIQFCIPAHREHRKTQDRN